MPEKFAVVGCLGTAWPLDMLPTSSALYARRRNQPVNAGMTRHVNDGVELLAGKRREAVRFVAVHTDVSGPRHRCLFGAPGRT